MTPIRFSILGLPQPKGSARIVPLLPRSRRFPFAIRSFGELLRLVAITSDNAKVNRWQREVSRAARLALGGVALEVTGAIELACVFYLPPPQSLPKDRGGLPIVKPDLDKLARAIADALTGVCYVDDAQITDLVSRKRYSVTPEGARVDVTVTPLAAGADLPLFERSLSHDAHIDRGIDITGRRFSRAHP